VLRYADGSTAHDGQWKDDQPCNRALSRCIVM
jgi:hypothetical protein